METTNEYFIEIAQRLYSDSYMGSLTKKKLHEKLAEQGFDSLMQSKCIKSLLDKNIIFSYNSANPPVIYKLREDIARGFIHNH